MRCPDRVAPWATGSFVRQCPEFAAALKDQPGPHWTNVMVYRGEAPNVEVGVLAPAAFTPQGRVVASELPGGRAATATHPANPGTIGQTHDALREYARANGLARTGLVWEVYGHPDESGLARPGPRLTSPGVHWTLATPLQHLSKPA
jgi:hypothetical protein